MAQSKEPITNTDHSLTNFASTRVATFQSTLVTKRPDGCKNEFKQHESGKVLLTLLWWSSLFFRLLLSSRLSYRCSSPIIMRPGPCPKDQQLFTNTVQLSTLISEIKSFHLNWLHIFRGHISMGSSPNVYVVNGVDFLVFS